MGSECINIRWISVEDQLPEDGQKVLCLWWNIHCVTRYNYDVMRFRKGRTAEEMENATVFRSADQWGNNKKPYCWDDERGYIHFGQDVFYWMPLPAPPKDID